MASEIKEEAGKFTPGPWEIVSELIGPLHIRPAGEVWSIAHVGHEDFAICQANARLIAAAPMLLEALKEVLGEIDNGPANPKAFSSVASHLPAGWEDACDQLKALAKTIRAVIAKAEGA